MRHACMHVCGRSCRNGLWRGRDHLETTGWRAISRSRREIMKVRVRVRVLKCYVDILTFDKSRARRKKPKRWCAYGSTSLQVVSVHLWPLYWYFAMGVCWTCWNVCIIRWCLFGPFEKSYHAYYYESGTRYQAPDIANELIGRNSEHAGTTVLSCTTRIGHRLATGADIIWRWKDWYIWNERMKEWMYTYLVWHQCDLNSSLRVSYQSCTRARARGNHRGKIIKMHGLYCILDK